MKRSFKLLIASSLLLNLLLAGVLIGHTCRYIMNSHSSMEEFISSLPESKRHALNDIIKKGQADAASLTNQLVISRNAVATTIQTEPFDVEAYRLQIKHLHDLKRQLRDHQAEMLEKVAMQCSPSERVALAEILRRPRPSFWPETDNIAPTPVQHHP